ncbi:MAG: hypothetical protein M0T70_14030 [Geobacteraceae bacterium]|nr:hypothetical protein [Geobacteraceae bacterium]
MSIKLGELLIKEGAITQDQLDEALKCHIIFGIKLGSSLIELGFIQESVLVNLLSKKLGVPAVGHSELFDVPADVIARLSSAVAEKFRVIPVRVENKRLYVAMSDPTDFKVQEELSFITGNIIVPLIAPEVYILVALEKYYAVTRDHRYVCVSTELQKRKDRQLQDESEDFITDEAKFTISADFAESGAGTELLTIRIPTDLHSVAPKKDSDNRRLSQKQTLELYTIDRLSRDFSTARDRDDVANIFIKYLGQEFTKGALLTIRGNGAVGWRAVSSERLIKDFETITLEISKSSELSEILIGKHYFFGPLSESPSNLPIIKALQLKASDTVLSLPVVMNDRVVAMLVVSSDVISLQQRLGELQKLVYKASLTFQILVLKNKLLQT